MSLARIIGFALIAGGLGGFGVLRASTLARRCDDLAQLRQALKVIQAAIEHVRLPARDAFARAASACRGCVATSLARAARALDAGPGLSAGESWLAAMRGLRDSCSWGAPEMDLFAELCLHLGRVDAATQVALLADVLGRLDGVLDQARRERDQYERLYRFAGLAAGVALAIMLL